MAIGIHPLTASIGAEITGVDLADISTDTAEELRKAWLDHKVLVLRDQHISQEQHVAFGRLFGDLEVHPFTENDDGHPEIVVLEAGGDTGRTFVAAGWHSDVTWRAEPSMGAILRSIQVPKTGGDTAFCDMAAAYDGLDDEMKERLEGLDAAHDYTLAFGSFVDDTKKAEMREQFPVVHHPVVRTHPETGRKLLFVNAYFTSHIIDMDPDESNALLRHLISRASIMEYQHRLNWEPGQVVFWDNRVVQHYALSDYYPDVRIMERASIVGDRPR